MSEVKETRPLMLAEQDGGRLLEVYLTGKISAEDYEPWIRAVEKMVKERGKIRMMIEMNDFHGPTMGALWRDLKFDARHFKDIERVAMVGETRWQHALAVFSKPFTAATVRYFDRADLDSARAWLTSG